CRRFALALAVPSGGLIIRNQLEQALRLLGDLVSAIGGPVIEPRRIVIWMLRWRQDDVAADTAYIDTRRYGARAVVNVATHNEIMMRAERARNCNARARQRAMLLYQPAQ